MLKGQAASWWPRRSKRKRFKHNPLVDGNSIAPIVLTFPKASRRRSSPSFSRKYRFYPKPEPSRSFPFHCDRSPQKNDREGHLGWTDGRRQSCSGRRFKVRSSLRRVVSPRPAGRGRATQGSLSSPGDPLIRLHTANSMERSRLRWNSGSLQGFSFRRKCLNGKTRQKTRQALPGDRPV